MLNPGRMIMIFNRSIQEVNASCIKYTDTAISGIAENVAHIKKQLRDDYYPKIVKLEEVISAGEKSTKEGISFFKTEKDPKLSDIYSKISNLLTMTNQLQQNVQELQKFNKKKPTSTTNKTGEIIEIKELVEDEINVHREQLATALKSYVATVEENIRNDISKNIQSVKALISNIENRFNSYGNTEGGSLIGLEEKYRKTSVEMGNLRGSVDAVWNSIAQLTARLSEIEAEIDK